MSETWMTDAELAEQRAQQARAAEKRQPKPRKRDAEVKADA